MVEKNDVMASIICEPPAVAAAINRCHECQALGIVIAAQNAPSMMECLDHVFEAYHAAGCRSSLWIVAVASQCDHIAAVTARHAVGAFGQVIQLHAASLRAAYSIGQRLIAEHFAARPIRAVETVTVDASRTGLGRRSNGNSALRPARLPAKAGDRLRLDG